MKLTIENNRERIKRYSHIKPAPRWGSVGCFAKCPGTLRTCTLEKSHSGPHVSHGRFNRVVAVWEGGTRATKSNQQRPGRVVGAATRRGLQDRGFVAALKAFRGRFLQRAPGIEEVFLLILALSMAGFALDWALRILGLR